MQPQRTNSAMGPMAGMSDAAAGPPETGLNKLLAPLRKVEVGGNPGLKDIHNFTTQLGVMIKAGISIRNAMSGIAAQTKKPKFQRILMMMRDDVESGIPFSEALAKHPKVFPPLYVNMIRASELSGSLGHMLDRIIDYLGQQIETRSMVIGAMVYPAIIFILAISATVFLLVGVLPTFKSIFAGKEDLMPATTTMLLNLSDFLKHKWYIVVGSVAVLLGLFLYGIRTPTGRIMWDKTKLKMPLFKRMFRALYITRGLQTMGELVNAGVPMLETLAITAEVSGNEVYKRMWRNVHNTVKQGGRVADPLLASGKLPPNVVQMIAAGEQSGKLGEVMQDIASFYQRELRNTIKAVTSMIEPLMIVVMGVVVGFIAMSMMLPIFKMSSIVK